MDEARTTYKKGKINIKFDAFKKDFGFELLPCRASTPETKGKVESQMKYLEEIRAYSGKLNLIELYDLSRKWQNTTNRVLERKKFLTAATTRTSKESIQN